MGSVPLIEQKPLPIESFSGHSTSWELMVVADRRGGDPSRRAVVAGLEIILPQEWTGDFTSGPDIRKKRPLAG